MLCLAGLSPAGIRMSDSGRRVIFSGLDGVVYRAFTRQVRGMLEQWGRKKAAIFVMRGRGKRGDPPFFGTCLSGNRRLGLSDN